ncbi:hypothetical protein FQN49_007193 [Arthroderma sp. PD_2]|nr:hypothetical protein FQN49_007193 [Arthroderma sp. PD_2]
MTEPPAKRARRTDSSAMWDLNGNITRSDSESKESGTISRKGISGKDGVIRNGPSRGERRARSRSQDRGDRKRDRSRSRDRRTRDYPRDTRRDTDREGRGGKDRDRSLSRDRHSSRHEYASRPKRHRERTLSRSPSRSRSPARNGRGVRTRSPPRRPAPGRGDAKHSRRRGDSREPNGVAGSARQSAKSSRQDEMEIDPRDDPDDLETAMMKAMGFSSFKSTQNTKVPGNNVSGVRKEKKTEYRQYMNRVGGFNKPLSPSR